MCLHLVTKEPDPEPLLPSLRVSESVALCLFVGCKTKSASVYRGLFFLNRRRKIPRKRCLFSLKPHNQNLGLEPLSRTGDPEIEGCTRLPVRHEFSRARTTDRKSIRFPFSTVEFNEKSSTFEKEYICREISISRWTTHCLRKRIPGSTVSAKKGQKDVK